MYAVGVGPKVNDLELRNIAGDETRVLKANNYDALLDLKDLLAFKTCVSKSGSLRMRLSP